ncbi:TonB-dependent receptor [Olivibacter sp. SA151]|uniref:SusC/RagA family TonB-linked outer membrane protein n=1 Tax=Olivibacter jilunii TaxID=985016 RepID=UPI00059E38FC
MPNSYLEAQQREITGIILDEADQPIMGASIKEKGTNNGASSDAKGTFRLIVQQNAVLEVSYIGYISQTIVLDESNEVRVTMKPDNQSLEEVVITGFGLSQKKATVTGAISTIGDKDIARSSAPTVSGALVGKIAGLNTRQTDGRPGSSTQIRIRNMGDPLYVIDGVQSDAGQFNNLDFNDIESISVLKDASASIYGVRAANGVIVVTTKKGSTNSKNTVSVTSYYGIQDNFKFVDPADAKTYVKNYVQGETLRGEDRSISPEDYDKWMVGTEAGYQGFNWLDYIWRSGPQYYLNANVSGGSDKSNYYVSVGHLKQDATIVNYGGFERTNAQLNLDTRINERFKIGVNLNGRIEERENPAVPGGDDYWLPRFAVLRNLPTKGPYANGNPLYPQKAGDDPQTNFAVLNYDISGRLIETWRVMQLRANAEYEILDGLKAKVLGSYYFANKIFNNQENPYTLYRYNTQTGEYETDYRMQDPYRERVYQNVEEITSNIQLAYDKKFGDHSINAIMGFETIKRKDPNLQVISRPTANNLHLINLDELRNFNDNGDNTQARLGWMGRFNYDYKGKYLAEFSGRYDGSWKFPPSHRWGFFPSGSVGWRISEEEFWKDWNWTQVFSDLKFRASYGLVGDDNVANYNAFDYMPGYNYKNGASVIDGAYVIGSRPRGLPVTTLSWIKAKIFDVGMDIAFLDNRLTAQVDYFNRIRTGLPASRYDVLLPSELGFNLPLENLNSDVNRGIDAAIRWSDHINDFNYSIGGNMTYARFYDWEQYDNRRSNSWDEYRNSIYHRVGYINWGLEAIGQFQSWEEIANYPIDNDRKGNTTLMPGDIKYKDVNGDGVINGMDERPIGYRQDATPILNFGLNFAFSYKNVDLAFDFSGTAFSSYYQRWEQAIPFQNNGNNPRFIFDDAWHLADVWDPNSEIIPGKYPMVRLNQGEHSNYWNSTFWKHNVTYVKLRNIELGYNFPAAWLSKAKISGLRIYFSGQNLFAISNVQGVDPEQQDENGLGYPTMRMYNLGLNLKF